MKSCPVCELVYSHELLQFCRFDGTRLVDTNWGEATTQLLPLPQMSIRNTGPHVERRTGDLKTPNPFR